MIAFGCLPMTNRLYDMSAINIGMITFKLQIVVYSVNSSTE